MSTKKTLLTSWPGHWTFVLAAVGSAAGLGNVWRFPYLAYEHGGAAFFIAYILCLVLVGFPLLLMENTMGQKTKKAAGEAMAAAHKSGVFRSIGFWGVLAASVVMGYYAVVMSWSVNFLVAAPSLAWAGDAKVFFFENILHLSDNISEKGEFLPHLLLGLLAVWTAIFLSLSRGMKSIATVVTYITPLPFFFLGILAINGLFLENAAEGLSFFFLPVFEKLLSFDLWIAAISQVFFTLTLGFGVMFAYGALLKKKTDIIAAVKAVIIGDTLVSFISGIAIFSTLGYMAGQQGVPVSEVVAGGPGLAFVVFPSALSILPFGNSLFAILFFLTLLTLAITSAISLVQAIISMISDYCSVKNHTLVVFLVCAFLAASSLLYARSNGLYILDIVDHYIVNYGLVAVGLAEVIVLGWVFGSQKIQKYANRHAKKPLGNWYNFSVRYFVPFVLAAVLGNSITNDLSRPYEGYASEALFSYGVIPVVSTFCIALLLSIPTRNCHK